jgi:hypothetical protein
MTKQKQIEPLPCLCGRKPRIETSRIHDDPYIWLVECTGGRGQRGHNVGIWYYKTRTGAIKAWNRLVSK